MQSRRERPAGWTPRPEGGRRDDGPEAGEGAGPPSRPLGDWLRETRLRKGLSFAEVERTTRINRHYLEALEAEHYDVIPAPVYARGFVRSYARMLGLDAEEAVARMPADLPRPPGLDPMPGLRRAGSDAPAIPLPQLPTLPGVSKVWLFVAAVIVFLVGLLWVVPAFTGNGNSTGPSGSSAQTQVPSFNQGETPNFVGVQRSVAEEVLRAIGAAPVAVEVPSDAPAGTVVAQTPQPATALKTGDTVTLVVSRGPLR
ncbi:MAG: helix-turn-helix domain-containing protein [Dehalococcoidia bacterium]|nr:helix-turn-helix domain-containing protein [Dehalococcoidia bacterium]